jgi:head-tail adaptor
MIEDYYRSAYTIMRPINTVDSGGSPIETFSDLISISGRMRPLNGSEILTNEKIGIKTSHRFYCGVIDVVEADRIYDGLNLKTYEIKFIKNPLEMNDHLEIDCELIDA